MEISGVQIVAVLLILVLFYFVFKIVETNWELKTEEEGAMKDEETMHIVVQEEELLRPAAPGGREIRLVPLKPRTVKPAAAFAKTVSREIAFSSAEEEDEVMELVKAR
jgi:hypothetical protein